MDLPASPVHVAGVGDVLRRSRHVAVGVPRRLVGVLDRVLGISGSDLEIGLLDHGHVIGGSVGEHGGDGARGALSSRLHADAEIAEVEGDRLDLGGRLEMPVPDGAHGQVGLGRGAAVGVALEVDVAGRVHHEDGGVRDGRVSLVASGQGVAVVPCLDFPPPLPVRRRKVAARHVGTGARGWIVDDLGYVDVLREAAEVEELVVAQELARRLVRLVADAVGVAGQGVVGSLARYASTKTSSPGGDDLAARRRRRQHGAVRGCCVRKHVLATSTPGKVDTDISGALLSATTSAAGHATHASSSPICVNSPALWGRFA